MGVECGWLLARQKAARNIEILVNVLIAEIPRAFQVIQGPIASIVHFSPLPVVVEYLSVPSFPTF